ncbi:ATP-dependent DNA helicase Q1-like [Montipora foliosa]|uniref:ATP-dependent DNA helicase Q1-like n=1 Tax=Montipora foliosa TaxID=591990 RepID=UPI0035F16463
MVDISAPEFSSSVKWVLEGFHIEKFRETQLEAIINLFQGKDVLVLQPTGSGKSLSFQSFPLIVDELRKPVHSSCALVISPLNSLMQDQVRFLTSIGIKAAFIGEEQNDEDIKKGVEAGLFQVLSPHVYNNSDELVFKLNAVESTCAVEFYTVVDTSRSPVHNIPCPLHWVRDSERSEDKINEWR